MQLIYKNNSIRFFTGCKDKDVNFCIGNKLGTFSSRSHKGSLPLGIPNFTNLKLARLLHRHFWLHNCDILYFTTRGITQEAETQPQSPQGSSLELTTSLMKLRSFSDGLLNHRNLPVGLSFLISQAVSMSHVPCCLELLLAGHQGQSPCTPDCGSVTFRVMFQDMSGISSTLVAFVSGASLPLSGEQRESLGLAQTQTSGGRVGLFLSFSTRRELTQSELQTEYSWKQYNIPQS